jgi:hypothetical protein
MNVLNYFNEAMELIEIKWLFTSLE